MLSEAYANTPIGDIFADQNFRGFIYDFYHFTYDPEDMPVAGEIYTAIFSDDAVYTDFMSYCRTHKRDFLASHTGKDIHTMLILGLFESIRGMLLEDVQELLGMPQSYIVSHMQDEGLCEEGVDDMWEGLRGAVEKGIPINSDGEVLYLLKVLKHNKFTVYSHESGVHIVDTEGNIVYSPSKERKRRKIEDREKNKEDRISILKTIQKLERFIYIQDTGDIFDENDLLLITAVNEEFKNKRGIDWQEVEGNPVSEREYKQKRSMFVFMMLMDLRNKYSVLQDEDTSGIDNITLVGGTDLGD